MPLIEMEVHDPGKAPMVMKKVFKEEEARQIAFGIESYRPTLSNGLRQVNAIRGNQNQQED